MSGDEELPGGYARACFVGNHKARHSFHAPRVPAELNSRSGRRLAGAL